MAAAAGVLIPTALGFPQWYEAGEKAIAGAPPKSCLMEYL